MSLTYLRGRPVVYRLFEGDRLLYVGRTTNVPRRMAEHKSQAWWFGFVTRGQFRLFPTVEAADDAERMAILDEAPVFNQMGTGQAWHAQSHWTPLDHQRHDEYMTALWAAQGKPYLRSVS